MEVAEFDLLPSAGCSTAVDSFTMVETLKPDWYNVKVQRAQRIRPQVRQHKYLVEERLSGTFFEFPM
jgi:hypothetical protein